MLVWRDDKHGTCFCLFCINAYMLGLQYTLGNLRSEFN